MLATACKSCQSWQQNMQNMQNKQNQTHQTKPTKPNLPNQTYQTKPTKPNLPNQTHKTKHTKPNLPNQTYWSKQSMPGSVVPLAMFNAYFSIEVSLHANCTSVQKYCNRCYFNMLLFLYYRKATHDWAGLDRNSDWTGQFIHKLFWRVVDFLNMNTINLCLYNCLPSKNMTPHSKGFASDCSLQVSTL